jgi:thiamine pyrophosphokinase
LGNKRVKATHAGGFRILEAEPMPRRFVIFANGELSDLDVARGLASAADGLICADGGYAHAQRLGLRPDAIVGDLDSLDVEAREALAGESVAFLVHPRHKDETDLELALSYAIGQGAEEIVILGALGGRLDQTMANLLLLANPAWKDVPIQVVEGRQKAFIVRGGETVTLAGTAGDTVSLIPLMGDASGVTLEGMEYPLLEDTIRFGSTLGVSNVLVSPPGRIHLRSGLLFVVRIKEGEKC